MAVLPMYCLMHNKDNPVNNWQIMWDHQKTYQHLLLANNNMPPSALFSQCRRIPPFPVKLRLSV